MEIHSHLSDAEFEKQFKDAVLDPAVFTHEAHLRLAWIHLTKYGREKAIQHICGQLVTFTKTIGAEDKYHQTLTIAAIEAVYHFIKLSKSDSFPGLITEFPQLKYRFKELINSHYKDDIFHLKKAQTEYLAPDLVPFDVD